MNQPQEINLISQFVINCISTVFKKVTINTKKKLKKMNNLLKKYVPLQCFNKQMIVLQI